MKAQELMLGDWVTVQQNRVNHLRVVATTNDYIEVADEDNHGGLEEYPPSALHGIPLTPEILEKNGFILYEDGWYCWDRYGVCDGNEYISIAFGDGGNSIYDLSILKGFENMDLHRNFLHELQHALRLCGIDKEIVL